MASSAQLTWDQVAGVDNDRIAKAYVLTPSRVCCEPRNYLKYQTMQMIVKVY